MISSRSHEDAAIDHLLLTIRRGDPIDSKYRVGRKISETNIERHFAADESSPDL